LLHEKSLQEQSDKISSLERKKLELQQLQASQADKTASLESELSMLMKKISKIQGESQMRERTVLDLEE
jgi:hypothetical protein